MIVAVAAGGGFLFSITLAVIQLVSHLRKKQGKLDVFFHHNPILGYAGWGPAIQVTMSLKAENRDVFVKAMDLEVVRVKDKMTHVMNWLLILSTRRNVKQADLSPLEGELAGGFSVLPKQPKLIEVLFHDRETWEQIASMREMLGDFFQKWLDENKHSYEDLEQDHALAEEVAKRFNKERDSSFFAEAEDLFYFKPGEYECKLSVHLKSGVYTKKFKFKLDAKKSKRLELNCVWLSTVSPPHKIHSFFFESPKADYSP